MKKIRKIALCVVVCLSMFLPFVTPVYASDGFVYEPVLNDDKCPNINGYPYFLHFYYFNTNSSGDYLVYEYFIYTSHEITVVSDFSDYAFFIGSYDVYKNLIYFTSKGEYLSTSFDNKLYSGIDVSNPSDVIVPLRFGGNVYKFISLNYDLKDTGGNVILKGDTSDNPPSQDVPTDGNWMNQLGSVWNNQWMIVIIGSTIFSVALGICLMWLVRRFRRLLR